MINLMNWSQKLKMNAIGKVQIKSNLKYVVFAIKSWDLYFITIVLDDKRIALYFQRVRTCNTSWPRWINEFTVLIRFTRTIGTWYKVCKPQIWVHYNFFKRRTGAPNSSNEIELAALKSLKKEEIEDYKRTVCIHILFRNSIDIQFPIILLDRNPSRCYKST